MNSLAQGWFSELGPLWPGQCFSLEIEETLHDQKSEFQHVQVFKTKSYGTMLVLDNCIQATERDEFSYQEMMAHVPSMAHPNPKKALVIGGGDGGVVRELCRHPSFESIILCEIDPVVTEVSRKFLPGMTSALTDPRVQVVHFDGLAYMDSNPGIFDVIVVDSSDPIGPAETLFQASFYHKVKNALSAGGIACFQAECIWLHMDFITKIYKTCKEIFNSAEYAYTTMPTYPNGQIGLLVCSNEEGKSCKKSVRDVPAAVEDACKYYTLDIHEASFVLPKFAAKALAQADTEVAASRS
eukprot:GILK01001090.1.p1 GENE.GILK01001090.1~~GILK01001090.1.p1  ORF type:complete len:297 (+),score=40.83 GILK01001090.1:69-959(+)